MKRPVSNAFIRFVPKGGKIAALLRSLSATLVETDFGYRLVLTPMRAVDAFALWSVISQCDWPSTLVFDVEQHRWTDHGVALSLHTVCQRLSIPTQTTLDHDHVVLCDHAIEDLFGIVDARRLRAVCIDGPVEMQDVIAINRAIHDDQSPLNAELRAVTSMKVLRDQTIVLDCRRLEQAMRLLAENFRHYLAALLDEPAESFTAPHPELIEQFMSITGEIRIRPIETDVFPTTVDIAVLVHNSDDDEHYVGPSLVFDRPTNTWHET